MQGENAQIGSGGQGLGTEGGVVYLELILIFLFQISAGC